ncbi:MAG: biotin--[acetyl-CoA-carboxylase] ligase [Isosphaeraceae bacterium]
MNIPLLLQLRDAGGQFLGIDYLGMDRDRLGVEVAELEAFGVALEWHPYLGIAYRGHAERLCPDLIEWSLGTQHVGRRVAVWNRVASTNDLAARAAGSLANDGLVILAEEQTAGRGRRGRAWSAPAQSSVLMSVLLFPPAWLADPGWLTALGAVATAEVVEAWTGQPARIKWPNDVRVEGRKVAGILVERGLGAVLGIGLNVNITAADLPADLQESATSLQVLRVEPLDRSEVVRSLIRRIDAHYLNGLNGDDALLNACWRDRLELRGLRVQVQTTSEIIHGCLFDANLRHGLTLKTDQGDARQVPGAEVVSMARAEDAPISI